MENIVDTTVVEPMVETPTVVEAAVEAVKETTQAITPVEVPVIEVLPQENQKFLGIDLSKFNVKKDGIVLGGVVLTTVAVVKITEKIAAAKPITKAKNAVKNVWNAMKSSSAVNLTQDEKPAPEQPQNAAPANEIQVPQQPSNNPAPQA